MTGDSPELFEADEEEPEVLGVRARRDFLEVRLEDLLDDRLEDLLRSDSDDEEDSRWCLTPREERFWCLGDLDRDLDGDLDGDRVRSFAGKEKLLKYQIEKSSIAGKRKALKNNF